ncbi:proline/glycine betaine ABC transporter permease [Paracoccus versutus]|uniref:Glycine betaine/proline transport system permease protein n=1 Tax=Paracoccus versutus TaxID=34007 RepID=A0A3D9XE95_PARVE|nr:MULTISPECIES: proline/glycine betaine ABC transporter permease [Paracoccus]KGJ01836.1 ABC transporter permease [Paracoccus versutus]REF68847.1 glycine betaine/proline transport system permease protein [Paracoccus versutus]REF68976.1 glycine betaine/proline transport system permease protein [Paracoccus versutus]REG26356.1 glycine betaine/proline transport system permease protein [Paracoccus versutus]REG54205.1 glycine betaine/proline transport system permease protein [Paracoccus versutus]
MTWLTSFPQLKSAWLRELQRVIDDGFRSFTRSHGDMIEGLFSPLQTMLIWFERLLLGTPWLLVLAVVAALAWGASRSLRVVIGSVLTLVLIGLFGMWDDTMKTISMVLAATLLSIAIGLPLGILMARSQRVQRIISPILDIMQTMPSFVYLIPVVMLLGIGRVPGLIAVVIYAIPPMIRLTNLGIRQVDREVLEATDAFGSSAWQKLVKAQLPLALPTIMAGINQTIMMALAMVVIASMIGVQGLGQPVLRAISNQYFTLGLFNGFAIVGIAILFDRISQAWGKRLQKHQEASHD